MGGEYPMASSSAAERSAVTPELRHLRAQQVILVFSNQVRPLPCLNRRDIATREWNA